MTDANKPKRSSETDDSDAASTQKTPAPAPAPSPVTITSSHRPFPATMNLYANYHSGILSAPTTHKLCGATEADFLYLVEIHFGYTPRGPLKFGRGFYLRNGTSTKDPVLAATGEGFSLSILASLLETETRVMVPALGGGGGEPGKMVTEMLRAASSKECGVAFGFGVEVGLTEVRREEFEWWKVEGKQGGGVQENGSRYMLHRLAASFASPSCSSSLPLVDDSGEIVAELAFDRLLTLKHIFTLDLKGAGLTGELGDRWALMVVMTSLSLQWLRQHGKTRKATVGAARKIHSMR